MQDEQRVQQLLDRDTGSRYFLVQAEDTQTLLARLDSLDTALDRAKRDVVLEKRLDNIVLLARGDC